MKFGLQKSLLCHNNWMLVIYTDLTLSLTVFKFIWSSALDNLLAQNILTAPPSLLYFLVLKTRKQIHLKVLPFFLLEHMS